MAGIDREKLKAQLLERQEQAGVAGTGAPAQTEPKDTGISGNLLVGVSRALGFPVDFANLMTDLVILKPPPPSDLEARRPSFEVSDRPIAGSRMIQEWFAEAGLAPPPGQEAEGFGARAAEIAGEVALPAAGIVGVGKSLARAAKEPASRIAKSVMAAGQRPLRFLAGESAAVAGAAGGGLVSEDILGEGPAQRAIGELVGALGGAGALAIGSPTIEGLRQGARLAGKAKKLLPGEKTTATPRAARRTRELSSDPEGDALRIEQSDLPGTLPPAMRSGNKRLMSLQRLAGENDPDLEAVFEARILETSKDARAAAAEVGKAEEFLSFLDKTVRDSALAAVNSLRKLQPTATVRQQSLAARNAIEKSLEVARGKERMVWARVGKGHSLRPNNAEQRFATELKGRTADSEPDDIPAFLFDRLGKMDKQGTFIPAKRGQREATLGSIQQLRSRVLDAVRKERGENAPNRNKIRILQDVADGLLDDLSTVPVAPVQTAVRYSRRLNDRFTRGAVGELLGFDRRGGRIVRPSETMEALLNARGETLREIVRETATASPSTKAFMEDFFRQSFTATAVNEATGTLVNRAAQTWLAKYSSALEEFPQLRKQIQDAVQKQGRVDDIIGPTQQSAMSPLVRHKTAMAMFWDQPIDIGINRILSNSSNPPRMIEQAVRFAEKDPSGRALKGLRGGMFEHLIRKAESSAVEEGGEFLVSGRRLRKLWKDNTLVMAKLYTTKQREFLENVIRRFEAIETFRGPLPPVGKELLNDAPAKLVSLAVRTAAARGGAKLGQGVSGAALVTAGFASRSAQETLKKLTNDQAKEVLAAALNDDELMTLLLRNLEELTPKQAAKLKTRVTATLIVPASSAVQPQREERKPSGRKEQLRRQLEERRAAQ